MLNIRPAVREDIALILQFIRELAEYEKDPKAAVATAEGLKRDGFSRNPKFRVLIAEWDGEPAGFAFFFYHYSTPVRRPAHHIPSGLSLPSAIPRQRHRQGAARVSCENRRPGKLRAL